MFQRARQHIATGVACGVLGGAVVATGIAAVQAAPQTRPQAPANADDAVRVGTFQPQEAFDQYHGMEQFAERTESLQRELQEAQQEGDQQRVMSVQVELQRLQQQLIDQFYDELEQAVPEVADTEGVQIVATEILYTADEVDEPVDMTIQLMEKVNEGADAAPRPQQPERPAPQP